MTGQVRATADARVEKKAGKFTSLDVLNRYINGLLVEAYEQMLSPVTRATLASRPKGASKR